MLLSIVIRNLNEAAALKRTLLSVKRQQVDFAYEVIVVDNESDDDSVEIANDFNCKVISLKRSEFTFGHALNYGIQHAQGAYVLILSAHILLLNEYFLKSLPAYFEQVQVAGLRFINAADNAGAEAAIEFGPQEIAAGKNVLNEHWQHLTINHCAAVRKSAWEKVHFDATIFAGEDKKWALDVLNAGYKLLYNVPCFYTYNRTLSRQQKIKRQAIETAAKELLTGKKEQQFNGSLVAVTLRRIGKEFRRSYAQLQVNSAVYKSINELRKKHFNR
ncbi:glycosyltransferase family 2 protein [Panacibacter sp. DH6]|uniref:Glycosyltransferase family 2 protein n=1 Tax=Panacibacter microcysteis TaxID=2793269 RepID=A0A931E849_9BACT|nr:glycosyltransferase family 2 protein [Panacibacter microcysteis]MBG9377136.1 glycosyltransferase family 2 protein [Panacibacter microcysteis]